MITNAHYIKTYNHLNLIIAFILPELPTTSSNLLLKVLPCGLLFLVLSFWGYSREYARAYGSTLIFSELLPATVAYYYPQIY